MRTCRRGHDQSIWRYTSPRGNFYCRLCQADSNKAYRIRQYERKVEKRRQAALWGLRHSPIPVADLVDVPEPPVIGHGLGTPPSLSALRERVPFLDGWLNLYAAIATDGFTVGPWEGISPTEPQPRQLSPGDAEYRIRRARRLLKLRRRALTAMGVA